MSTRERREEYSTANVVRVLHPSRPLSPNNVVTDLDNNLDNLLDDLQSSVIRSQNNSNYSNSQNYSTKSRDVEYLSPSNTTTVVKERSISPGRSGQKIYKTSHYEYSTSTSGSGGGGGGQDLQPLQMNAQKNINQLDSLLQDLKHERTTTLERSDKEKNYSNNTGIDSGLLEPVGHVTKTTRTYTSSNDRQRSVNRELQYDSSPDTPHSRSRSRARSPNYQKSIETNIVRDVTYDSDPVPDINTLSKRSYTSDYSTVNRHQQVVPYQNNEIVEIDPVDFPKELNGVPLSSDILPGPGTKVTTTIKTFTYEIPADTNVPTNQQFLYKNEHYNSTNTTNTLYPERDVPYRVSSPQPPSGNQTTIYNTITSTNRNDGYPNEPRARSPHPEPITTNKSMIYKRDTKETTTNVYPVPPGGRGHTPQPQIQPTQPSPNQSTIIYKHDITNTNTNIHHPPPAGGVSVYPREPAYLPPARGEPTGYPNSPDTKHTYIYKHETSNTKNTVYGPPGGPVSPYPNGGYPSQPSQNNYPPHGALPAKPAHLIDSSSPPTNNVMYKYSSSTTTRNVHGGGHPDDREPLLAPAPFPTDGMDRVDGGQPPKRLDDLLASFPENGNGPYPGDEGYIPRKEVNTALATGKAVAIVEPKVPSKNIAGPPVYYPPGHEFSMKNEQSGAAWRAQGGYAKASGKYEYEAESKSKSSSKSGAAVVPVCLPLCCAMPCVIM